MTKTMSTLTEKLEIIALLKEHLTYVEGEDRVVEYADGWDDRKISETVNRNFSAAHTAGIRVELHGNLRVLNKKKKAVPANVQEALDHLENCIMGIRMRIDHIETLLNMKDD